MSKHLSEQQNTTAPQRIEPKAIKSDQPAPLASPFFSFRYSYSEISSVGGKTYVRAKQSRFENGKLTSEEFEGVTDGRHYEDAVRGMQNLMFSRMTAFFKLFSAFLPTAPTKKNK